MGDGLFNISTIPPPQAWDIFLETPSWLFMQTLLPVLEESGAKLIWTHCFPSVILVYSYEKQPFISFIQHCPEVMSILLKNYVTEKNKRIFLTWRHQFLGPRDEYSLLQILKTATFRKDCLICVSEILLLTELTWACFCKQYICGLIWLCYLVRIWRAIGLRVVKDEHVIKTIESVTQLVIFQFCLGLYHILMLFFPLSVFYFSEVNHLPMKRVIIS